MHSAHRILNAVWFHSIRNQRHQVVCALAEKNDWRIQINSEKLFQIICAKQRRTKGKGLKKNRMVQSETGSDQNGSHGSEMLQFSKQSHYNLLTFCPDFSNRLVSRKKCPTAKYLNSPMPSTNRLPSTFVNPQVKIRISGPKYWCRDTWMIFWFFKLDFFLCLFT